MVVLEVVVVEEAVGLESSQDTVSHTHQLLLRLSDHLNAGEGLAVGEEFEVSVHQLELCFVSAESEPSKLPVLVAVGEQIQFSDFAVLRRCHRHPPEQLQQALRVGIVACM